MLAGPADVLKLFPDKVGAFQRDPGGYRRSGCLRQSCLLRSFRRPPDGSDAELG